jgi:hypothetical protein
MLRGFKASELLLSECVAPDREYHVVPLVGGFGLDNLTDRLLPMSYPVARRQIAPQSRLQGSAVKAPWPR